MKSSLIWAVLGLAALAAVLAVLGWKLMGPVHWGVQGYLAYGFGCALTAVCAIVLMRLAFFSDSEGYDDINRKG